MTGKPTDNNATGLLVLILPLAITIVVVLKAWPFLLILMALIIVGRIWDSIRWRKWTQEVNPFFTELIKENQGCITPLDLSLKANLTAKAAHRFLEKKAQEYGAQKKVYAEKGVVYYFLTASALGSIFADSDQLLELEDSEKLETSPQLSTSSEKFPQLSTKEIADLGAEKESISSSTEEIKTEIPSSPEITDLIPEKPSISSPTEETETQSPVESSSPEEEQVEETLSVETVISEESPPPDEQNLATDLPPPEEHVEETLSVETVTSEESPPPSEQIEETLSVETVISEESPPPDEQNLATDLPPPSEQKSETLALIQADLAKRLDINPSTVARRKSDADFSLWSQTKDPEGIAWKYLPKTKMFIPVDS